MQIQQILAKVNGDIKVGIGKVKSGITHAIPDSASSINLIILLNLYFEIITLIAWVEPLLSTDTTYTPGT